MRASPRLLAIALIAPAAVALATGGAACSDAPPSQLDDGAGPTGAGGSGGDGGAFVDSGKELWADLEPELFEACGTCHDAGGIGDAPFLAGPDRYASVLSWPGVVVSDPAKSLFATYPVSGGSHTGINLDTRPDLFGRVKAWLAAEAGSIPETPEGTPFIEPFTPILGFNAIYLNEVDDKLVGVALTFSAEELTDNVLELSGIEVHTTAKTGVHIVHPVFGVYPKGGEAESDPVDSYSGLDHKFAESTSEALGPGTLLLTNWQAGAKLGIGFELCDPYTEGGGEGGAGGGGSTGGCNAVAEFTANATPLLTANCQSCHGGGDPQANAALDMSGLGSDDAAACAQVKNRVSTANPASSQTFVNTNPDGNAAHPFKFGGSTAQWQAFMAGMTIWIEAE